MTTDLALSVIPIERQDWFINLVGECKDIVTETEFTSRWALVEGYHSLGSRILSENENFERAKVYGEGICNAVAESLQKKPRTIYYAIQFAKAYPDLSLLPEGKNISFHHIINKYLTTGEKRAIVTKGELMKQIEKIKKLLNTEYLKAHQEEMTLTPASYEYDSNRAIIKFIRYLQDQVNKITGVDK